MTEETNNLETTNLVETTPTTPSVEPTEAEMNALAAENVDTADVQHGDKDLEAAAELQAEEQNYAQLNKQELVDLAQAIVKEKDLTEASHIFKLIKPVFEQLLADERTHALNEFVEAGRSKDPSSGTVVTRVGGS